MIAIKGVSDDMDLMIINRSGIAIRMAVSNLRVTGRATQGVKLINLRNNDSIAAVTQVLSKEEENEEILNNEEADNNSENNEHVAE